MLLLKRLCYFSLDIIAMLIRCCFATALRFADAMFILLRAYALCLRATP